MRLALARTLNHIFSKASATLMVATFAMASLQVSAESDEDNSGEKFIDLGYFGTVTGDIELGFLFIGGNTDAKGWRVNTEMVHELEYFRNRYNVYGRVQENRVRNSTTNEVSRITSAKRYGFSGQSNYKFLTGTQTVFGRGAYAYDMFGAFRQQGSAVVGYANRVYERQSDYLDLETGPGMSYQESAAGNTNRGLVWFLALNLEQTLYKGSRFRQTFEGSVSLDGENSVFISRSTLTSQVNGRMSMRMSFIARHNSRPEGRLKTMDTETAASLVYSF